MVGGTATSPPAGTNHSGSPQLASSFDGLRLKNDGSNRKYSTVDFFGGPSSQWIQQRDRQDLEQKTRL